MQGLHLRRRAVGAVRGRAAGADTYLRNKPRLPFRYVSVHAPVKHQGLTSRARATAGRASGLGQIHRRAPGCLFRLGAYQSLGTRLVLENMDDRKNTGRTADEIETVLRGAADAGFCLDVAHAWSIDPTMIVAHELLDRFRSRLRHVHLSSLSDGHHVPVAPEDESLFAEVLDRCRDVPGFSKRVRLRHGRRSCARRVWRRLVRSSASHSA